MLARIYRPLPGLRSPLERVSSDLFSFDLHRASHRGSTSGLSPSCTRGVRRLTMLVHRFNAQPTTIQKYHCPCCDHRLTVMPHGFRGCGLSRGRSSSPCGSRQQECLRRSAIKLSIFELRGSSCPSTKSWGTHTFLLVETFLKNFSGIFVEHFSAQ